MQIHIGSRANTFFARVFGFFGAGTALIGALTAFGAHRIAVAQPGSSELGLRIAGLALVAIGAWMLAWTVRQLRAIGTIAIGDDRGWTLITRGGTRIAAPVGDAALELRGRNVWVIYSAVPRRLNVCDGWLVIGDRRWRMPKIAPSAYDDVLRELGISGSAPRNNDARYVVRRAA
jgi:uncharacterized protein YjeT (DUF2065 family)